MAQGAWQSAGGGGGAGASAFDELTDYDTADIPALNTPTATALSAKADLVDGRLPSDQLPLGVAANRVTARLATTANVTIATALNNGDTIDGVALVTGDLVLVCQQTAPAENGVYTVAASPARATAYTTFDDHVGLDVYVSVGTANAGTVWAFTVEAGGVLGTTALTVTKTSNQGLLAASNNLSDVADVTTAQQNLSLEPGVDVQAYSSTLASVVSGGLGVASSTAIPTRADGDGRWLRWYTALPATNAANADQKAILLTDGYQGVVIESDELGAWSIVDGSVTFAEMMAIASPASGMTVLVSTIDLGGTAGVVTVNAIYTYTDKWRPTHPIRLWGGAGANTVTNSQTSFQDVLEMVPPVGLFFAGSEIWGNIHTTPSGAGTATYVPQLISGSVTCTSNTTVATGSHLRGTPWLWCNTDDTLSSAGTSGGMDDFVQPTLPHNTMSSPFDGSTITLRLGNTFSGTGTDKTITFDRISLILMP